MEKLKNFGIVGIKAKLKKSGEDQEPPLIGRLTFVFSNGTVSPPAGSYKEEPPRNIIKL
jgi:hypothetical protein